MFVNYTSPSINKTSTEQAPGYAYFCTQPWSMKLYLHVQFGDISTSTQNMAATSDFAIAKSTELFWLKKVNQRPIRQKIGVVSGKALITTCGCGLAITTPIGSCLCY